MADAKVTAADIAVAPAPQPPLADLENAISLGTAVFHREPKLPATEDVLSVVRRYSSIEPPERALDYHWYLMALVLTYCDTPDILTFDRYLWRADYRKALEHAPPGVFDPRSWNYWNLVCGRTPVPPMPKRKIPGVDPKDIPDLDPRWSR